MVTVHLREKDAQEAAKGEALAIDRVKCAIEVALRQKKSRADRKTSRPSKLPRAPRKAPSWKQLGATVRGSWPTKLLRLALWQRSEGRCECGCRRRITWEHSELDHYLGKARAPQSPENCWLIHAQCHDDKHAAKPSRWFWHQRFLLHLEQHGFGRSETAKALRDELAAEEQLQEAQRHAALAVSSAENLATRARRPTRGDRGDRRCGLAGEPIAGRPVACVPLEPGDGSWCHGCNFYVCEAHEAGTGVFGAHSLMKHLERPDA